MQATSMRRFATHLIGVVAATLVIALTGTVAIYTTVDRSTAIHSQASLPSDVRQVSAFVSPMQGEGLVDATINNAVKRQVSVHIGLGQGEGLIGPGASDSYRAFTTSLLKAHIGLGQGEGFVGPGVALDPKILQKAAVKAYPDIYQGEGLIDVSNRPAPRPLLAYLSAQQGEGLIGPGGGN